MTTIPAEPKKKHRLTQEDCDTARLLMARRRTLKEIGEIIGVDPSTVGKIRLAGYNLEKYLDQRKAMNEKTRENKRKKSALNTFMEQQGEKNDKLILQQLVREAAGGIAKGVEQVAGQIQMELPEAEDPEQVEKAKTMRFFAAQVDKIAKRLDMLIDVLQKGGGSHE